MFKRLIPIGLVAALVAVAGLTAAVAGGGMTVAPFSFSPRGLGDFTPSQGPASHARWEKQDGDWVLSVAKNVPTSEVSSAGAQIKGVEGIELTTIGFDYNGYCGAGAPRFNVSATDGFHFLGGCANGTSTPLGGGWFHLTIDPSSAAQAFPPIAPGATILSISILFDETGSVLLDNIFVNEMVVGGPNDNRK